MMSTRWFLHVSAMVLMAGMAAADVRLPRIFSDNMVIQRGQPIRVWGVAAPDETVRVSLAGQSASAKADARGAWAVELPAMEKGEGLELTVAGKNTLTLRNLVVGDVWVCSGQSNMEMALGGCLGAAEDIKAADLPRIRRIKVTHTQSVVPQPELPVAGAWQICSPQVAGGFTAVGFYFAREVQAASGVAIGIVDDNWGGTAIEPWIAPGGLALVPELQGTLAARSNALAAYQQLLTAHLDAVERWVAAGRAALAAGQALPASPALPPHPGATGWCSMYHAMVSPITKFPVRGVLWYQGESNGSEGETYGHKMRALVGGWRQAWGQGDFPFYFVQLASYMHASDVPAGGDGWANLREAQRKALSIPNTGMAVILDTVPARESTDIHPKDKYDVGVRLARWALNRDYGSKTLVPSGPLYQGMKVESGKIRLSFESCGTGLMVGTKEGRAAAVEAAGGKLKRFAIAGADKKWVWADAVIDGQTVVVSSPDVKEPVAVRYAFSMNPEGANLYNREGLPASPFRTDDW
jgi:sialate O-acetylesterase